MSDENVKTEAPYTQVCVWPGTIVGSSKVEEFKQFFLDEFNARVVYLEEIKTLPDTDGDGVVEPDTGGRNDVYFAVHSDDLGHFAVPRLKMGIRWIDDVLDNEQYRLDEGKQSRSIYPSRVSGYRSW